MEVQRREKLFVVVESVADGETPSVETVPDCFMKGYVVGGGC